MKQSIINCQPAGLLVALSELLRVYIPGPPAAGEGLCFLILLVKSRNTVLRYNQSMMESCWEICIPKTGLQKVHLHHLPCAAPLGLGGVHSCLHRTAEELGAQACLEQCLHGYTHQFGVKNKAGEGGESYKSHGAWDLQPASWCVRQKNTQCLLQAGLSHMCQGR